MDTVSRYKIRDEISQGLYSIVYAGTCAQDGKSVVLKTLRREFLSTEQIDSFKKEFEITKTFEGTSGIIQALSIDSFENSIAIVLEDFGAKSLDHYLQTKVLSLAQTLQIAVSISNALAEIHAHHLMHKDINPKNIIYNPDTGIAKIIDFGIASSVSRENPSVEINELIGTLPYISPEQTGRMNRLVDYRTDFYSLGATLYEMLTGQPPFQANDPLEIVHCHIARQPIRVDVLKPEIPAVVGDIVAKLLAKTAEERYQTAEGVTADLEHCLQQLMDTGTIHPFPIGKRDFNDNLILGQKLYGRSKEIERLLAEFERVLSEGNGLFLISGSSGVGKTALVNEVHKPMTERRGFFVSSKFDQFDRNTPYMAIVNAFNQLARQLLTQSDQQILEWRTKLTDVLQENGGIITETIPDMGLIMGPQAKLDSLPPVETKNRFQIVFQKFVGVLANSEHPIVLFLDDLQWADIASLELIEQLMTSTESRALYIIGAYRDNEVSPGDPLAQMIDDLRSSGAAVTEVLIHPLSQSDINQLIAEALSAKEEEISELAGLVYEKTYGNPFFVNQLLESFHTEELLFFNRNNSKWQWKLDAIKKYGYSDNVVDLLVTKIDKLSPFCRKILQHAACIGTVFNTNLLTVLQPHDDEQLEEALEEAVSLGLLQRVALTAPLIPQNRAAARQTVGSEYKFTHDRILQAVYLNIPEAERLDIHRRIGQLLVERWGADSEDQHLFQTVLHLNLSRVKIESEVEKKRLSELNLEAGKKAKQSAANKSALEYLETGISLLGTDSWQNDYELTLALHEEAAEAAHLATEKTKVRRFTDTIFSNSRDVLDEVKAIEVKIRSLFADDRNVEVTHLGTQYLSKLGINIPHTPGKLSLVTALLRAKLSLLGKTDEDLLELPPMSEEKKLASLRILSAMSLSAYTTNKNLYAYAILTQVNFIAKYGHSVYSPSTFCSFGLILCGKLGKIEQGNRFGKLAIRLMDTYFERARVCRVQAIANGFIFPYKIHILQTGAALQKTYRLGIDGGDFQYATTAIGQYINQMLAFGVTNVEKLASETRTYLMATKNMKQNFWWLFMAIHLHIIRNFIDDAPDCCVLDGEEGTEQSLLDLAKQNNNETCEWIIYAGKLMLHCYFDHCETGIPLTRNMRRLYHAATGTSTSATAMFWEGIIYLRGTKDWNSAEGKLNRGLLKKIRQELARRAQHAPQNYLCLVKLIDAEQHRLRGNNSLAIEGYDQAIDLAIDSRQLNIEALANELAADFYLSLGKKTNARAYAENARFAYIRWGARAKVKNIEDKFGGLLQKTNFQSPHHTTTSLTSSTAQIPSLDFHSVFKAARGISKEIILENLLESLIRTATESAGAEKGFLIMEEERKLRIEAGCLYDNDELVTFQTGDLSEHQDICHPIVRYVARTKTPVVIGDAPLEGDFTSDDYIQKYRVNSILCMPIILSEKLLGILYLENRRTKDVFTEQRLAVLEVIASQAAISIRNAKLYLELSESKALLQKALEGAQESDRIKTSFLDRTGHELRTPLNAMINIPEWILENISSRSGARCTHCRSQFVPEFTDNIDDVKICPSCGKPNSLEAKNVYSCKLEVEEIDHKLRTVVKSGKRLSDIVDDILSFSDLQIGKANVELEAVNIDWMFQGVKKEFDQEVSRRCLEIVTENASSLPQLRVDRQKFQKVLSILVKNAIQFSPDKEKILLRAENDHDGVIIFVRDHGVGIDKENSKLIFDSFRQAREDSTRRHGGTGLGLAIAKNIVELHGGEIWVESELGRGSTFFIRLTRGLL